MRFIRAAWVNLSVILLMPAVLLLFVNIYKALSGRGFEPWADNYIMYVLLVVLLAAAGAVVALFHAWSGLKPETARDVARFALAGALGAGSLMVFVDAADSYFTPQGIGWVHPLIGIFLGTAFGVAYRLACGRVLRGPSG